VCPYPAPRHRRGGGRLAGARRTDQTVDWERSADGTTRLLSLSAGNRPFRQSQGVVAIVTLHADDSLLSGRYDCLRTSPSHKAKAVKMRPSTELSFHPLAINGQWAKVVTSDGRSTGWMHRDKICSNPLTTCP